MKAVRALGIARPEWVPDYFRISNRDIGTLLAISVPDGATIFLDDIRFVGAK